MWCCRPTVFSTTGSNKQSFVVCRPFYTVAGIPHAGLPLRSLPLEPLHSRQFFITKAHSQGRWVRGSGTRSVVPERLKRNLLGSLQGAGGARQKRREPLGPSGGGGSVCVFYEPRGRRERGVDGFGNWGACSCVCNCVACMGPVPFMPCEDLAEYVRGQDMFCRGRGRLAIPTFGERRDRPGSRSLSQSL